jgi:hypothetical protein
VVDGIRQVLSRHEALKVAIVTGVGAFIAAHAADIAGLEVVPLAGDIGDAAARCAPAAAVALLLEGGPDSPSLAAASCGAARSYARSRGQDRRQSVGVSEYLDRTLATISRVAREARVLIVPGGGPFADAIRDVDERVGVPDDAAHWMAALGMDQYAHLLVARLSNAVLVENAGSITDALAASRVPVLAPSHWLRSADPLPHSWEVTSDSIAAWVAGVMHAPHIVLVKPPGASGSQLVDGYLNERGLPPPRYWLWPPIGWTRPTSSPRSCVEGHGAISALDQVIDHRPVDLVVGPHADPLATTVRGGEELSSLQQPIDVRLRYMERDRCAAAPDLERDERSFPGLEVRMAPGGRLAGFRKRQTPRDAAA